MGFVPHVLHELHEASFFALCGLEDRPLGCGWQALSSVSFVSASMVDGDVAILVQKGGMVPMARAVLIRRDFSFSPLYFLFLLLRTARKANPLDRPLIANRG